LGFIFIKEVKEAYPEPKSSIAISTFLVLFSVESVSKRSKNSSMEDSVISYF